MPLQTQVKPSFTASPGGKASSAPVRARTYCPKEFSSALEEAGVLRTERWVREQCALNRIRTLEHFKPRLFIPESELSRLLSIQEARA